MQKCLKCDPNDSSIVYTHEHVMTRCNHCGRMYETKQQKIINRNFQKLAKQKERDRVIFSTVMLLLILVYVIMESF